MVTKEKVVENAKLFSDVLQGSKSSFLEGSPRPPEMLKPRAKKGSLISAIVQFSLKWIKNNVRNLNKLCSIY